MVALHPPRQSREWRKDGFLVSTDPDKISLAKVNLFMDTEEMHWTRSMPEPLLDQVIRNSLSFGLYDMANESDPIMVGMARAITDHVTFLYLTDVYVEKDYQGRGLGKWMIGCLKEITDSMPYLRSTVLLTSDWRRSVPFYQQLLGARVMDGRRTEDGSGTGMAVLSARGRGNVHKD